MPGFAAALRLLPRDEDLRPVAIDGLGAGLLGVSMLGLIYGLIDGSTAGWTAGPAGCLVVGAVFLVAFGIRQLKARDPLIQPALLRNRGFTSGLLLGLGYFAAVNGFAYVISLFFQLGLGLSPELAAVSLAPMMAGIIIASLVGRPLITQARPRPGRRRPAHDAAGRGRPVRHRGGRGHLGQRLAAGPVGAGARRRNGRLLQQHLRRGDRRRGGEEAGSASGSLSAVQQLAAAIGSAVVTTVYFAQAGHGTAVHALAVSVAVVAGITLACLGLVWLLPRTAPADPRDAA